MAMTPEGRVKAQIKALLKERGIWYYMPVQNGMGQVGIPDFICCWEGRFIAIEAKAPGLVGNTTANQQRVLNEIHEHGGYAFVVDNVETLRKLLDLVYADILGANVRL